MIVDSKTIQARIEAAGDVGQGNRRAARSARTSAQWQERRKQRQTYERAPAPARAKLRLRADVLRAWCAENGYSKRALGRGLGFAENTLYQLARGHQAPSADFVAALLGYTGEDFDYFFAVDLAGSWTPPAVSLPARGGNLWLGWGEPLSSAEVSA